MMQSSSSIIGPIFGLVFTGVDMPEALDGFQLGQYVQDDHCDVAVIIGSGKCRPGPEEISPATSCRSRIRRRPWSTM